MFGNIFTGCDPFGSHKLKEMFIHILQKKNINGCKLVLEEADCCVVLISQHSKFMPVNFMYSEFLIFQ